MENFSFLTTSLLVNGVEISGFDEGDDVIQLARRVESFNDKVGADGVMTAYQSSNLSGTVTFRLMQSSDSNKYLSGLMAAQENSLFESVFAQFKDPSTGDVASGTQGYIPKPADMVRGVAPNAQEWIIIVERLDLLHLGG